MSNQGIPTPHIGAKEGEIAKTVLLPGDPKRAKFIADTFLENVICFNEVRGMLGFTGEYKGKKISVMGSGMGMPSIGIYSYELFKFYDVENIIRIGSCGAFFADMEVFTIIVPTAAHSDSNFMKVLNGKDDKVLYPDKSLNEKIIATAKEQNIDIVQCPILSSDVFYGFNDKRFEEFIIPSGSQAVEMEAFALFANAQCLNKKATCILTVSDNIATNVVTTSLEREQNLKGMIKLSLDSFYNL